MTVAQQIARLEMLLGRVRRNAAAPRPRLSTQARSSVIPPSDAGQRIEPVELSDDDILAVVSEPPPAAELEAVGPPAASSRVEPMPAAAPPAEESLLRPEDLDLDLDLDDVLPVPEPSPAASQPSEARGAKEEPAAPPEPAAAAEPAKAAAEQRAPVPAAPSAELLDEDDLLELESVPPSAVIAEKTIPEPARPPVPVLELDEPGQVDLEPDEPAADSWPEVAPAPAGSAPVPEPVEPRMAVATDQPAEVIRRPAISADVEPAILSKAVPIAEPQTFLQWLEGSLKLG
jgi:hypothetical protein